MSLIRRLTRAYRRRFPDYFSRGVSDGKKALFTDLPSALVDGAAIRARATEAAARLQGRVSEPNAAHYVIGWIMGYEALRDEAQRRTGTLRS